MTRPSTTAFSMLSPSSGSASSAWSAQRHRMTEIFTDSTSEQGGPHV